MATPEICFGDFCVEIGFPLGFPGGGGGGGGGGGPVPRPAIPPGDALPFEPPPSRPIPGVVVPQTNPFGIPGFGGPTVQKADVVFKKFPVFGRVLGPGGFLILGAELLVKEIERRQLERIAEKQQAIEDDLDAEKRRRARDTAVQTIPEARADPPPGGFPDEPQQPFIVFPPIFLPESLPQPRRVEPQTETLPEIQFPSVEVPLPSIGTEFPGRVDLPSPTPVALPGEVAAPVPATPPVVNPFEIPSPVTLSPGSFALSSAIERLLTAANPFTSGLTASEALSVPLAETASLAQNLPLTQTQPVRAQVDQCKPRTCDDELDEPRVQCFKGLYREGILDTDFTQWAEIDCLTGKEL